MVYDSFVMQLVRRRPAGVGVNNIIWHGQCSTKALRAGRHARSVFVSSEGSDHTAHRSASRSNQIPSPRRSEQAHTHSRQHPQRPRRVHAAKKASLTAHSRSQRPRARRGWHPPRRAARLPLPCPRRCWVLRDRSSSFGGSFWTCLGMKRAC